MEHQVEQLLAQGRSLAANFEQEGATRYIDEAIVHDRNALGHCTSGHPLRAACLIQLALHLRTRYEVLGKMENLDEAVLFGRDALALCPPGHPGRATSLNNLAAYIYTRYTQLGGIKELEEAIVLDREAMSSCPPGHQDRPLILNNLAQHLHARYTQLGGVEDLEEAIILSRNALMLPPLISGHPDRWTLLNNLSGCLYTRCTQLGGMQDIEEAIIIVREALTLCPQGSPNWSTSLNTLALHLTVRYNQVGEIDDLNEAIILSRDCLVLRPPGHPDRAASLNNLAQHLYVRFSQLGGIEDLDEAIILVKDGLALCSPGHPHRSTPLSNLAAFFYTRYMQLGTMQDLDEAIILDRQVLVLRSHGHPERLMALNNLAVHIYTRYTQLGGVEDLGQSLVFAREARMLCPQGHSQLSVVLNNLTQCLYSRHMRLGEVEDLNEVIVLDREALARCPPGLLDRSTLLNNFADHIYTRYSQLGKVADLEEAILLGRQALVLRPTEHPNRHTSLNNLSFQLSTRYNSLGKIDDLNEAIVLGREALSLCPPGHRARSSNLHNLTLLLCARYKQLYATKDYEELFRVFTSLQHDPQTISLEDTLATQAWTEAAEAFHHPTTLLAYKTALRSLVHYLAIVPPSPQNLSMLKDITSSLAVDAFSACLRNESPMSAVELLEQGRSVFWNQLIRLRSPLDDIIASGPEGKMLAEDFRRLSSLVRNALDSPGQDQHDRVCHLNLELQNVASIIRGLPGLSSFLLPTLFTDLQRAASDGPIIIMNASQYGCDALIIFASRDPAHIPLSVTKKDVQGLSLKLHRLTVRATRLDVTRELGVFLRELWDRVVSPIFDFLLTRCPRQSRVWWCPTAEFILLPLHAAGPYRKGQHNFTDLFISSYTPTFSALIRTRRHYPSDVGEEHKHFLAIGQANADGERELHSVGTELANIGQCIDSLATFRCIEGQESSVSRVTEELSEHEWVHLACHGRPNRQHPFESAFVLQDGHFTIQRIIQCELKNPEFAYLSACHTTVGDEQSPDEAIHLASAMQFVGFRSVIGTMWAVDDAETNKITSVFYRHMVDESGRLDHTRAAYALWKTMKMVNVPLDQRILYIHIGA